MNVVAKNVAGEISAQPHTIYIDLGPVYTEIGDVTCGGSPHRSCKGDQIKMRDFMDRWVTSPTWVPPPCKQALSMLVPILYNFAQIANK